MDLQRRGAWKRGWCARWAAGRCNLGLSGERRLTEWEVPWMPGHQGSAPVRIGNAACSQRQLDVFGEVMDALHQARRHGRP
jgi:GH15 family glucan-1,4-alpha-glucosidase